MSTLTFSINFSFNESGIQSADSTWNLISTLELAEAEIIFGIDKDIVEVCHLG